MLVICQYCTQCFEQSSWACSRDSFPNHFATIEHAGFSNNSDLGSVLLLIPCHYILDGWYFIIFVFTSFFFCINVHRSTSTMKKDLEFLITQVNYSRIIVQGSVSWPTWSNGHKTDSISGNTCLLSSQDHKCKITVTESNYPL